MTPECREQAPAVMITRIACKTGALARTSVHAFQVHA